MTLLMKSTIIVENTIFVPGTFEYLVVFALNSKAQTLDKIASLYYKANHYLNQMSHLYPHNQLV